MTVNAEKPAEITLFINWFKYMFQDRKELVEELKGIEEVKSMLRTSIKKYGEQLAKESKLEGIKEGKLEGKLETARALINKKMPIKEISEVTGLPVEEIKKLHKS